MEQLTVKEAIEQGYTKYLFGGGGYQRLNDIDDIPDYILVRDDLVLVEKTSYNVTGLSSKDLAELVADHVSCNCDGDTGDDTGQVYDAIKELDFSEMAAKIQEVLNGINYYRATDIKLVP